MNSMMSSLDKRVCLENLGCLRPSQEWMRGKSGLKRNLAYTRTGRLYGLPELSELGEVDMLDFRNEPGGDEMIGS
jgi:hypothetical protein